MALSHSHHPDVRGSTFNDVGHDQFNNVRIDNLVIQYIMSRQGSIAEQSPHDLQPITTEAPRPVADDPVSTVLSNINIAFGHINNIVSLLSTESSHGYQHLEEDLKSLFKSLFFTRQVIQVYKCTPLGPSLSKTIFPDLQRCSVLLQGLSDQVSQHRKSSDSTSMNLVYWSGLVDDEIDSWRMKLSACQELLCTFLITLNSVTWMDLGNELLAGHVPIGGFPASLRKYLASFRHIPISKVVVVDHLGQNLPVPTLFCSTWKDFDYIINGYCNNRVGNHFIKRGDYQVLRAQDSQMIGRSEIAGMVEPEMVLEISIILRQEFGFTNICPRCGHVNSNVPADRGWIECDSCPGQFQVAKDDEIRNENSVQEGGHDSGQESDQKQNDIGNEEIISPAAYVGPFWFKRLNISVDDSAREKNQADSDDPLPLDNDGREFCRLIRLILVYSDTIRGRLVSGPDNKDKHLYSHDDQVQFFKHVAISPAAGSGPFILQRMYKPHTNSDRRRYVDLEWPIMFWSEHPDECGIPLSDAMHSRVKRLLCRDETVFEGRGPSVSIRLEWPGYRQWSREIPTKDFRNPPRPITRAKLAKNVAKCISRFISEKQNRPLEEEADEKWRVGNNTGPGQIKLDDLILVSLHHVSMFSWQPHLKLRRPFH